MKKHADWVVYILRRETRRGRCKGEPEPGDFISLADGEALCLDCAGLVQIEYLSVGDWAGLCHGPLDTSISHPSAVRPTTLTRTRRFLS